MAASPASNNADLAITSSNDVSSHFLPNVLTAVGFSSKNLATEVKQNPVELSTSATVQAIEDEFEELGTTQPEIQSSKDYDDWLYVHGHGTEHDAIATALVTTDCNTPGSVGWFKKLTGNYCHSRISYVL